MTLKIFILNISKRSPTLYKKSTFILKIILAITFYNQIFVSEYDQFKDVEDGQISKNKKKKIYLNLDFQIFLTIKKKII